MNFDEIKERLRDELKSFWDRIQDSSLYTQIKEKYENLTPQMQKITLFAMGAVFLFLVLSTPVAYVTTASENIAEFEEKRNVIRSLLQVTRDAKDMPNIPTPPPLESIQSNVDGILQSARLMPEQIVSNELTNEISSLIPANLMGGSVRVALSKLNIRQVMDISYELQNISQSVKLKDMQLQASADKSGYFDVQFVLVALNVPKIEIAPAIEDDAPKTKNRFNRSAPKNRNNSDTDTETEAEGSEE